MSNSEAESNENGKYFHYFMYANWQCTCFRCWKSRFHACVVTPAEYICSGFGGHNVLLSFPRLPIRINLVRHLLTFENDWVSRSFENTLFFTKILIYKLSKYNLSYRSSVSYFQDYEIITYRTHNFEWIVDLYTRVVKFVSSGNENRLVWLITSCDCNSFAAYHYTLS